jgi:hypothetical protein
VRALYLLDPDVPGLPAGLADGGTVLSHGWDVETSDREAFFSLTQPHGRKPEARAGDAGTSRYRTVMPEGRWELELSTGMDGTTVHRAQTLTATGPVLVQDFVCRYRFPTAVFPRARISGRELRHTGSNIWHEYRTGEVELIGPDRTVTVRTRFTPTGRAALRLDHYVRDEPGPDWVVHARLIPDPEALRWLRWDTRWGRLLDVRNPAVLRLLTTARLDRRLWYLAERRGGRPNLELLGLAALDPGTALRLDSWLTVHRTGPGGGPR